MDELYQSFCNYIGACEKLTPILWDSIASTELLEPDVRQRHFIDRYEAMDEFSELTEALDDWCTDKPDEEDDLFGYGDYIDCLRGFVRGFFRRSGIYARVLAGRTFDRNKAFSRLWDELEKTETKVVTHAEVFGLNTQLKNEEKVKVGEFVLQPDLSEYNIEDETYFVFLFRSFSRELHQWVPVTNLDERHAIQGDSPFSMPLLALNLYFDRPVYVREWCEATVDLLPFGYRRCRASEHSGRAGVDFWSALDETYGGMALEAALTYESTRTYGDWDKYGAFLHSKAREFIETGQAPINYLKESELHTFTEFAAKVVGVLQNVQKKTYLQIAARYYLRAHERPDMADNLLNYIIALEALYFQTSVPDLTERFGNRIASLLAGTEGERSSIREAMSGAYRARCRYVHGDTHDIIRVMREKLGKEINVEYALRNTVRASLLSFLALGQHYDSRNKRKGLLGQLDNTSSLSIVEPVRLQASQYRSLARAYRLTEELDEGDRKVVRV